MPAHVPSDNAGNSRAPTQFVIATYDVLPPAIRAKVEDSAFNWDTAAILDDLRHGANERDILAKMDDFEFAQVVVRGCSRMI
jgi:hypothetical protein